MSLEKNHRISLKAMSYPSIEQWIYQNYGCSVTKSQQREALGQYLAKYKVRLILTISK